MLKRLVSTFAVLGLVAACGHSNKTTLPAPSAEVTKLTAKADADPMLVLNRHHDVTTTS